MALASTTRSPIVPLTLKSGSRTPHRAPRRDIAAVPTAWNTLHPTGSVSFERGVIYGLTYVEEWFLAYWAISSSVSADPRGSHGVPMNPSQARAVVNRLASLMAATIVLMSKSVDKKLGLMMGGSNGFALPSLTSPPVKNGMRDQTIWRKG